GPRIDAGGLSGPAWGARTRARRALTGFNPDGRPSLEPCLVLREALLVCVEHRGIVGLPQPRGAGVLSTETGRPRGREAVRSGGHLVSPPGRGSPAERSRLRLRA